ncbi:MAG TPA: LexA family transcriptional regulator [Mucilaginibacter sp.]|nr:LexA family transcriptional regulator [Mucilaginibacter sp.]
MSFFNINIRFLREQKEFSQERLGEELGLSRNKLQALESGKTKNPTTEDILKFSDYFGVAIDTLLKTDLTKLDPHKLEKLLAGNDDFITGKNLRILAITVDKNDNENVEYVPVKAKAGYRSGYNDPEFIATLPRLSLPSLPNTGTFRMFPTTGDSMFPIPENSDVICRFVENWKNIKPETPCIVILNGEQEFLFKLVTILSSGKVELKSLNHNYAPYIIDNQEILEVWEYYKHQTGILPEPKTELNEIKALIVNLASRLLHKKTKIS